MPKIKPCPDCLGTGIARNLFVFKTTCPRCQGTGRIEAMNPVTGFVKDPPALLLLVVVSSAAFGALQLLGVIAYGPVFDPAPILGWLALTLALGVLFVAATYAVGLLGMASNVLPLSTIGGCALTLAQLIGGGLLAFVLAAASLSLIVEDAVHFDTAPLPLLALWVTTLALYMASIDPAAAFNKD